MTTHLRFACWLLAALCTGTALSGCLPTRAEMVSAVKGYTLPADVMRGKGLIYVIDTIPMMFPISKTVLLDGDDDAAKIGSLMPGTYIYIHVLPGHHRIKMPECSPYEMVVEVEEGDILFLRPFVDQRQKKKLIQQIDGVLGRYSVMRYRHADTVLSVDPKEELPKESRH